MIDGMWRCALKVGNYYIIFIIIIVIIIIIISICNTEVSRCGSQKS